MVHELRDGRMIVKLFLRGVTFRQLGVINLIIQLIMFFFPRSSRFLEFDGNFDCTLIYEYNSIPRRIKLH